MDFGVILGDVPASTEPREQLDALLRQVAAAQDAGFALLSIGQHFLYGDVRWLQPVPTLARLAAEVDDHVRLAITVVIAPLYGPVLLAEELATLDILTAGRLTVGLGLGYRREEFRQLGVPWEKRVSRFEELVPLLDALWTQDEVTHDGPNWQLDAARPHIRPVQRPRPPIWIGASGPVGVRRAARLGDAWTIGPRLPMAEIEPLLAVYAAERRALGRPVGRQPLRREIVLGSDELDARNLFTAMTAQRHAEYFAHEHPGSGDDDAAAAVLGTPAAVRTELEHLATRLPVGPIVIRAQWPGMTSAGVASYLAELGREVVAPLATNPSRPAAPR